MTPTEPRPILLAGVPSEVEQALRYHMSGRTLAAAASLAEVPADAEAVIVWVADMDAWQTALTWAATAPLGLRRIALVAHTFTPDPFTSPKAREAGLEVYSPATPSDLPLLLSAERHWWAPAGSESAEGGATPEPKVIERIVEREKIVERRVAVSTRPVLVGVAGVAAGVGTTTLAAAVAGFLARQGHRVALTEANPAPSLALLAQCAIGGQWAPNLTVYPGVNLQVVREVEQSRAHQYIITDLGAAPRSVLSQVDADLVLVCLPSEVHRWPRVRGWLHQAADAARASKADDRTIDAAIHQDQTLPRSARYVLVSPQARDLRDLTEAWESETARCTTPPEAPQAIPIADKTSFPAGHRHRDEPLDEALSHLLAPVLPDQPPHRRGLFGGFRSRPRPRRLPPAEDRNPEPARPQPAPAPRAPAPRAGGGGQHITVRVGDGASALDRIAGVLETLWRLGLAAATVYGVLFVLSRIPGSPPWAMHGYAWASGVLASAWRAVGGH